jgi:hypothetical protein
MSDVPDGWIELFHRTSAETAELIGRVRRFQSKEGDKDTGPVYFSNRDQGYYAAGYGEGCVRVVMPIHAVELDDEFDTGERHYRVPANKIRGEWISVWYRTPDTIGGVYLQDLCEMIDNERALREQVMELALRAHKATWLAERERAVELGKEIAELFIKPVPLIASMDTPMAPVARLVRRFFDHVDTDDLGRYYLKDAEEEATFS